MQGLTRRGPKWSKTPREVPKSQQRTIGASEKQWTREERLERVEDTWEGFGRRIRALGEMVFVRTDSPDKITPGGIIIPDTSGDFHAGLPKEVTVLATVVAAGSETDVKPGDRVLFMRLDFAWQHKFRDDGSYLGWCRDTDGSVLLMVDRMDDED